MDMMCLDAKSVTERACRSCGGSGIETFLEFGKTPLADRLLTSSDISEPEPIFPLRVAFCKDCSLVQITETVNPIILFADSYPYYSSFSPALLKHSRANALDLINRRGLGPESLVIELASNDGYLLKNYVEAGIRVLGIDPADGPAAAAERVGVPTRCAFFTRDLAETLRAQGMRADIVHANNVLAHVADTNGFVAGIARLLKDDGVAVIEAPYVEPLIEHCEFDTIYHEHLCYFSVTALDKLFRRHGLYLNEVKHLSIHGGSLRLYVETRENVGATVQEQLAHEASRGIDAIGYFRDFSTKVDALKRDLSTLLGRLKSQGATIAAYGAAAKGATLINTVGIGCDLVDFVVDRNVHKHNKYMPGQRLPIRSTEALLEVQPDYVLLLAWNFVDEILDQQAEYRARGGKFILPVPTPRII
ncbi:class I SAM-dependent methyltransferase [Mesorhizobium sp.]|uniref:class I SAM-dependent methyltransferase n=1 Tax=Mesorhizobium sp. TaxID=1871066 RepID=UPI00257E39B3|nr:class I SAM-dependent methyltransferase [Mesorhizobium sp.]